MNNLEASLTEITTLEFNRLEAEYPEERKLLSTLRKLILDELARRSSDLVALEEFVDSIQNEGGSLDVSGMVYADLYDFQDALRKCIRASLSHDQMMFPSVCVKLTPAKTPKGGAAAASSKRGERTKLGGRPDWIQGEATPICSECKQPMTFVAQIDSIGSSKSALGRSLAKAKAFVFADDGMIYVFWCRSCNETRSLLQSY